ncbi:hypothetical protein ACFSKL_10185 [Belliella marina]|uniref:Crp/Fnr family transcriptional regulator n=1 Tax=Belliella marina TaxID=1644146 RepID=A0ABW4VN70_9BACT
MEELINQMKKDYDKLFVIDRKEYVRLFEYLEIRTFSKGEVIKNHDEVEVVSRYVHSGEIALYEYKSKDLLCRRIFNPQEIACDFESYWSESNSNILLKAFTDVKVSELAKFKEFEVIESIPEFAKLALRINHRNTKIDHQWRRLHWMDKKEAYKALQRLSSVFSLISVKDISTILNIPERTVFRLRKELTKE